MLSTSSNGSNSFKPIRKSVKFSKTKSYNDQCIINEATESNAADQFDERVLVPAPLNDMIESAMEDVNATIDGGEEDNVQFPVLSASDELHQAKPEKQLLMQMRRIMVPPHRMSPLKKNWLHIIEPIVKHMKLLVRMNVKRRCVELKMTPKTPEISYLQKAADFVKSFMLGFEVQDGIALLRLNDLFLESFEIKDVKNLVGDNLSRCIGRISGKEGKTKYAIENSTRTRIVLADSHIHILGAFHNIKAARDCICSLILGSPTGKVYNRLRTISRRLQERQ